MPRAIEASQWHSHAEAALFDEPRAQEYTIQTIRPSLVDIRQRIDLQPNLSRFSLATPLAIIPPLRTTILQVSCYTIIVVSVLLFYFTYNLNMPVTNLLSTPPISTLLRPYFPDPIWMHMVTALTTSFCLLVLMRRLGLSGLFYRYVLPLAAPLITLGLSLLINNYILKEAFGLMRPQDYSVSLEPRITKFMMRMTGDSKAFPSGYMVRQVVSFLLLMWFLSHPVLRHYFSSFTWMCMVGVNALLLPVVGIERIIIGSHTMLDVLAGATFGLLVFWLIVVPTSAIVSAPSLRLLPYLITVWQFFAVVFLFYSHNLMLWGIWSLVVYTALLLELKYLEHSFRKRSADTVKKAISSISTGKVIYLNGGV